MKPVQKAPAPRRAATSSPATVRACCGPQLQLHRAASVDLRVQPKSGRRKPAMTVQTKLTLGPAGDRYEQEADSVARQVMQHLSSPAPELAEPAEASTAEVPTTEAPTAEVAQRFDDLDEDELQMKSDFGAEGGPIDADLESSIQRARAGGRSLDDGVRGPMESAFGADFSGVRVHTDSRSSGLNQTLQARAFTTGQDIFFRQGEYRPGNSAGKELLAHELTHVVQQNGDRVLS